LPPTYAVAAKSARREVRALALEVGCRICRWKYAKYAKYAKYDKYGKYGRVVCSGCFR
jgi:hypothetical protein